MTTASELLARVERVYASCRSYRDIGEVTSVRIDGAHAWQRRTTRLPFQTAFVRPDRFLFEAKEMTLGPNTEWPHMALWKRGARLCSWRTIDGGRRDEFESLESALSALAEFSAGVSQLVPRWLGLVAGTPQLPRADDVDLVGPEEVDGRACFRLHGRRFGHPSALWIDAKSALVVRRFERQLFTPELVRARLEFELGDPALSAERRRELERTPVLEREFTLERTCFWRPELDLAIDDDVFELAPPR